MGAVVRYTLVPRELPEMVGRVIIEFVCKILGLLLDRAIRTGAARFLSPKSSSRDSSKIQENETVDVSQTEPNASQVDVSAEIQVTGTDGSETKDAEAAQSTTQFIAESEFSGSEFTDSAREPPREKFIAVALVQILYLIVVAGSSMMYCHAFYLIVSDRVPLFYGGTGHL
jgi:hypothetical protein